MAELADLGFRVDTSGLQRGERAMSGYARTGERTERRITSSTQAISRSFASMSATISASLAAIGIASFSDDLIKNSDAWKNINSQLRLVINSEKELIATRTQLISLSRETRSDLSTTVELYAELTRNAGSLGVSQEKVLNVTKTLNNLFLAGGKPISESAGAITQLNQALASGVLRGDEFNSVAEGAPKILDALSESLGMAKGELRAFAATGGITAKELVKALDSYSGKASEMAGKVQKTFDQSLTVSKTNILEYVGSLKSLNSTIDSMGAAIEGATSNLSALTEAGKSGLAVVGVGLGASLAATSISITKNTAATVSATAANYNRLKSEAVLHKAQLATATAELNNLKIQKAAHAASIARVANDAQASRFRVQLAAVNHKLAVSEAAVSAATVRTAASQKAAATSTIALTGASKALRVATSALLSPWGMVITALGVAAFAYSDVTEAAESAAEQQDKHADKINKLASAYADFSNGRLIEKYTSAQLKSSKAEAEIIKIRDEIERKTQSLTSATVMYSQSQDAVKSKIKALNNDIEKQNKIIKEESITISAINKIFDEAIEKTENWTEVTSKAASNSAKRQAAQKEVTASFDRQMTSLATLAIQASMTSDEYELLENKMIAIAYGASPEMLTAINNQVMANQRLSASLDLDETIGDIEGIGGAWTRTGSIIADSLGGISDALDDYSAKMKDIKGLNAAVDIQAKKLGDDNEKIIKARSMLEEESFKAQLSGYKDVAGAASKMFKENSKERKALHAIEMGLSAIEIAMSLQKAGASMAAGAAKMFEQSGWGGFAGVAAMTAVLAGFGLSSSGGSNYSAEEQQDKQGRGTVFGSDDKSDSILNATERFNDIGIDQLNELISIRTALSGIDASTQRLAALVVRAEFESGGINQDVITRGSSQFATGGFKKELQDIGIQAGVTSLSDVITNGVDAALFDVSDYYQRNALRFNDHKITEALSGEISDQINDVFKFIGQSVSGAADALGIKSSVQDLFIDAFTISTKDLSGEDIQKALQNVFSAQADLLAEKLVPSIAEYNKVGEGSFETLLRVTQEQISFNDALEKMGGELSTLDQTQAILGLTGGLSEFNSLFNDFFNSFYTKSEQFNAAQKSVVDIFDRLGLSMVDSREQFKDLVAGVDRSTLAGQQLFSTLLQISPAIDDYIDQLEAVEDKRSSLTIDLLKAQGKDEEALLLTRRKSLEAVDDSLKALQLQVWAEQDRAKAINESERALSGFISNVKAVIGVSRSLDIDSALQAARTGNFDLAAQLDTNSINNSVSGNSFAQQAFEKAVNQNKLLAIADLAQAQLTDSDKQLNALESIDSGIFTLNDNLSNYMAYAPVDNNANMSQQNNELLTEVRAMKSELEQIKFASNSTAKHTAATSSNTYKIYKDGIPVEIEV